MMIRMMTVMRSLSVARDDDAKDDDDDDKDDDCGANYHRSVVCITNAAS